MMGKSSEQAVVAREENSGVVRCFNSYLELCKPRVVLLIVFTALVGMLLAVPGLPPVDKLVYGLLGIGLAAAAAAAINHWADQKADAIMLRTRHRPLPSGELKDYQVLLFALVMTVIAMATLVWKVNTLTAILTFASLIGYAFIYTFFLKRITPQNIVIGGAAGAAPPVLGWAAVTGQVTPESLLLFLIIFAWTPPHFWALAIHRKEDYAKAGIPMLPVTHGVKVTQLHILLYTIILFLVSLLPYLIGLSGLIYLAGAVILGLWFLAYAVRLPRSQDPMLPWKMFKFSIWYLMLLFAVLLIDHYAPGHHLNPRVPQTPILSGADGI